MQLLSGRWAVAFGQFTLNGTLKVDDLESCLSAVASAFAIPAQPEKEYRLAAPCDLFDPGGPVTVRHFLSEDGSTWLGCGTRLVANTPSPALVEAAFRRRAREQFGDDWDKIKKKRLNGLRFATKRDLAASTPFRLTEAGALFICVQTGELITVGNAGMAVAKDLVGRTSIITRADFRDPKAASKPQILAILRRQEESILPWPSGTASLVRKRGDVTETCSVRGLNWAANSQDAADLLASNWRPIKIELNWGDGRFGTAGLSGGLVSVRWQDRITAPDPAEAIESRLGRLLEMDAAVRALFVAAAGPALPLDE